MPDACLFCGIALGEIPATIIAESAMSIAFRDAGPQAPTHTLIIPRSHVESLNQLTDPGMMTDLITLVQRVALAEQIADRGYRVVINTHHDGGQSVPHLHLHVLGGRTMRWPPG